MASSFKNKRSVLQFLFGIAGLALFLVVLASGVIPIEKIGGVVGNNLDNKLDATPLFYSDSDDMPRLEEGLSAKLHANKKTD